MRSTKLVVTAVMLTFALFFGCGDEGTGPGGVNGIGGKVTYKDGTTPVAGATVTATSTLTEATYTTTSGNDGSFSFPNAADGTYNVTADKGSFHAQGQVTVTGGKSTAITLKLDIDPSKIGVVPGAYDDIGQILTDLGYTYTTLDDSDLADPSKLTPLELLFLNCGSDTSYAAEATVQDNLRNYVEGGGYLYASDWDYVYVEYCWPTAIDFYGNDLSDPYAGTTQTVMGDVLDTGLAGYLGKNQAQIYFDLSGWVVMDAVDSSTDILVQGDISIYTGNLTDKPLMVSFEKGSGIVAYTSFHNEAQISEDARKLLLYFISLTPA